MTPFRVGAGVIVVVRRGGEGGCGRTGIFTAVRATIVIQEGLGGGGEVVVVVVVDPTTAANVAAATAPSAPHASLGLVYIAENFEIIAGRVVGGD